MKIEKVGDIKAPGDGILSVSFQPHPINDKWDLERVAICGEKGVSIWSFDYNGNHHKLAFIESTTNSIIKSSRWSNDGKYLAIVDMEQISIYYRDDNENVQSNNFKSYNSDNYQETVFDESEHLFENWALYTFFSSSDINECTDICWVTGSKILINGTVSGNLLVYNIDEKYQSCNLFVKDLIETGLKDRNIKQNVHEVGHVSGLNVDNKGLFLACQMSNKKLYIFEIKYNYTDIKSKTLSKRNCIQLSYLLEEERLISNSPYIFTFIRRPIFDPITCLVGCPYGEVRTSYFSCLYPFKDISSNSPFGWVEVNNIIGNKNINNEKIMDDVWNLKNISLNGKLEFPEAYRLRGHQRRIRLFKFSSTIINANNELFTLCAQSSQDGSISFWKVIYDLNIENKIKSIECFLVLSNFMDEQASVTDISFNNMNNTILIGSDDNKLTLINFEFDEFSLLKLSNTDMSTIYNSNWNDWNFEYIPVKPSINISENNNNGNESKIKNVQKLKIPTITVNEIIEHQERTEESKITSKGTKIRRIQPINLTSLSDDKNNIGDMNNNTNFINNNDNTTPTKNEKVRTSNNYNNNSLELQSNNEDLSIVDKKNVENNVNDSNLSINSGVCDNSSKQRENFVNDFYLGLFMRDWIKNIKYPKRLSINFDTKIDNLTYKMCIFVDNRKVLDNLNKNREVYTEVVCIKQEINNHEIVSENIKNDILWFKPIKNNHIVTHLLRIKDILLIFYSNYVSKDSNLFINTNIDILNVKTGTNIITGITLPYVLKLTLCSNLDMILLITINGKLKLFEIQTLFYNFETSKTNINWILDVDWSYLNDSKLNKVDLFSQKNQLRQVNNFQANKNSYNNMIKPIVVLYYDDGKVFSYSFDLENFIRIDDLDYYRSDYWSMIFHKTAMEYTKNNDKRFSLFKDLSISVSDKNDEEYEVYNVTITNDYSNQCDDHLSDYCQKDNDINNLTSQDSFLLREIQKTSRFIYLGRQISKSPHEKLFTLFGHIIGNLINTDSIYNSSENDKESNLDDNSECNYEIYKKRSVMCTRMHIEHQMSSSLVIKSKSELLYWFKVYIRHVIESLEADTMRVIVNNCIGMIRDSIFINEHSSKRVSSFPVWHNFDALNNIGLDPIQLLLNNIIPFIDEYIELFDNSKDITELMSLYNEQSNSGEQIQKCRKELYNIKTEIIEKIKEIKESYEESKKSEQTNYNTQSNYSSQNSNTNNTYYSRLDFLNSIFN